MQEKKIHIIFTIFIILPISALSAWRATAIFGLASLSSPSWWLAWLGLTVGFGLFWGAVLYLIRFRLLLRKPEADASPQWFTAIIGAVGCGFLGLLLASPAGLSRITLELTAENVWAPDSFTVSWLKDGIWDAPFQLPNHEAVPATLEIVARPQIQSVAAVAEQPNPAAPPEVWLVNALWPDGTAIPAEAFQVEQGWEQHEVNWGSYENQSVWVSSAAGQQSEPSPAVLRWTGVAPGPLTLVFAKHDQAGEVTVRWNDQEQTLDLYAPSTAFESITLAAEEPVIWRAALPWSALDSEETNLTITPDPAGNYAAVLQKLSLVGVPGQTVELSGSDLLAALQVKGGRAELSATGGVQFTPDEPDEPVQIFITAPLVSDVTWLRFIPWLENGLFILYLAALGFIVLGALARWLSPNVLIPLNRVTVSVLVILFIGEVGPRFYFPPPGHYYVWTPNLHQVFKPDPEALPGITGESNFIVNSQGMRGDEFSPQDDYRILTIGASTTECLYLDQTEAWPYLVQDRLNQNEQGLQTWIGNIGKSARKTHDHILQLRYLLPQYPDLDAVVLLLGASDLFLTLRWGESRDNPYYSTGPGTRQAAMQRAFDVVVEQDPYAPYYEQTATWRILRRVWQAQTQVGETEEIEVEDEAGHVYIERRAKRQEAVIEDTLPDLTAGLAEYTDNVNKIIDLAKAHEVRVILMTQPMLWRPDLTEAEEALLWLGQGPGREYFYSAAALDEAISLYNQRLLEICDQRQVECLDLAPAVPKTSDIFYDDAHYTEAGARVVAEVVADYLLSRPPFGPAQ